MHDGNNKRKKRIRCTKKTKENCMLATGILQLCTCLYVVVDFSTWVVPLDKPEEDIRHQFEVWCAKALQHQRKTRGIHSLLLKEPDSSQ